jgi:hypothetical protein
MPVDLEGVVSNGPIVDDTKTVTLPLLHSEDGPWSSRATFVSPTTIDQPTIGDTAYRRLSTGYKCEQKSETHGSAPSAKYFSVRAGAGV